MLCIAYVLIVPTPKYTYLALGDSYTEGYKAGFHNDYAHQAVELLRSQHISIGAPRIIAYHGWTTGQLLRALDKAHLKDTFTFVSLLIGTNNQNGSWGVTGYAIELGQLLKEAITLTGGHPQRVLVLSLPDYGRTPYAVNKDAARISAEMQQYNAACEELARHYNCTWVDITALSNNYSKDPGYFADDGLHPSEKGHAVWAQALAKSMKALLPQ